MELGHVSSKELGNIGCKIAKAFPLFLTCKNVDVL